jgi:DNA-binding NtrC family response regulator
MSELKRHLDLYDFRLVKAANLSDSSVLITGATGTGKSYLARLIHQESQRAKSKFLSINLATLSENLLESELFGHEKGAFTGADTRRIGKLELCHGGTVLLDEIGELSLRLQTKLLDFIQYKKIVPVGSTREIELNVRIIAATNKNLEEEVKKGNFREDLFHRLNVFHVHLKSLAGQTQKIIELANKFLQNRNQETGKQILGFSNETLECLKNYHWSGNIRELQNAIEFAHAVEETKVIEVSSLPRSIYPPQDLDESYSNYLDQDETKSLIEDTENEDEGTDTLNNSNNDFNLNHHSLNEFDFSSVFKNLKYHESKEAFERAFLIHALKSCNGRINLTSKCTGLNKVTLREKIEKHGINWREIKEKAVSAKSI